MLLVTSQEMACCRWLTRGGNRSKCNHFQHIDPGFLLDTCQNMSEILILHSNVNTNIDNNSCFLDFSSAYMSNLWWSSWCWGGILQALKTITFLPKLSSPTNKTEDIHLNNFFRLNFVVKGQLFIIKQIFLLFRYNISSCVVSAWNLELMMNQWTSLKLRFPSWKEFSTFDWSIDLLFRIPNEHQFFLS